MQMREAPYAVIDGHAHSFSTFFSMDQTTKALKLLKLSKSQQLKTMLLLKTPTWILQKVFPQKALFDIVGPSIGLNLIAAAYCGQEQKKVTAAHFVPLLKIDKSRGLHNWSEIVGPSQVGRPEVCCFHSSPPPVSWMPRKWDFFFFFWQMEYLCHQTETCVLLSGLRTGAW